jgi:hypothetical protein
MLDDNSPGLRELERRGTGNEFPIGNFWTEDLSLFGNSKPVPLRSEPAAPYFPSRVLDGSGGTC